MHGKRFKSIRSFLALLVTCHLTLVTALMMPAHTQGQQETPPPPAPPRPFNFSKLCNFGAREAHAPFLLFLNYDVEALAPDWLGRMLEFAAKPDIGPVGAKLLYPDGRLQHGGVVLGLDGFAGHVQRLLGADDPGYLGELAWPREVAAVTGACLAVEARKFAVPQRLEIRRIGRRHGAQHPRLRTDPERVAAELSGVMWASPICGAPPK